MTNILIALVLVIIITVLILVSLLLIIKLRKQNMYKIISNDLTNSFENHSDFCLLRSKNEIYDFLLTFKGSTYYIKVIENFSNAEICVNNKTMWQLRPNAFDETLKIVNTNELLMNLELKEDEGHKEYKLFIIYPNVRSLLMYINECEMVFVNPNTDVYGANIITYKKFTKDPTIIDKNQSVRSKRKVNTY